MNIVACVKQVLDPEAPPGSFQVDPSGQKVVARRGVNKVISTYDESALEAALQLKDQYGGTVTLLSLGPRAAADFLKEAMASGADGAILLCDEVFEGGDGFSTAYALARGIERKGSYDLILCGRQASDTDAGVVGPSIAEYLGVPCATLVRKIEVEDARIRIQRAVQGGFQVVELPMPALLTVTSELYQIRYSTLDTILAAEEKEVAVWNAQDVRAEGSKAGMAGSRTTQLRLWVPERDVQCQVFESDDQEDASAKLVKALRGEGVI